MQILPWLTLVLIVLKSTHVLEWSWWWIVSPLWLPWAFALAVFVVIRVHTVWK